MEVKVPRNESSREREGYRERKSQEANWPGAKEPGSELARVILANSGAKRLGTGVNTIQSNVLA